jgi:hypothetical protein
VDGEGPSQRSYLGCMAPPRRLAELGTAEAIAEDLGFARDAGGLVRAGADRLAATVALTGEMDEVAALDAARELLRACTQRICARIEQTEDAEPERVAAARSVRAILLQPADEPIAAKAARQRALERTGCFMAPDSLRKREGPVLRAIASLAWEEANKRGPQDLPTAEGLLERLAQAAVILRTAVEPLIEMLVVRAEYLDEEKLTWLLDHTYWALGELLIWPRAAYDELRAMPDRPIEYWVLEQECLTLLVLPFEAEPADAVTLMNARLAAPEPGGFFNSVMVNSVSCDVGQRLLGWLESCTDSCKYHRSHKIALMCGPHQYLCLLDDLVDAVKHLRSGEYGREVRRVLGPVVGGAGPA